MVRSARRTRHPPCELAPGQCQDRRPAGSRAAGSARMIGAPPGPPGDRRALRRRSSAYPEVALDGPFASPPPTHTPSTYGRRPRGKPTRGPTAKQPRAWGWSYEWHTSDAGPGRCWAPMSGSAGTRAQPVGHDSPTRHRRASLVPKLADYQDELARARAGAASRGQTKAAPERAGEGGNSRAGGLATRNAGGVPLGTPAEWLLSASAPSWRAPTIEGSPGARLSAASGLTVAALKARRRPPWAWRPGAEVQGGPEPFRPPFLGPPAAGKGQASSSHPCDRVSPTSQGYLLPA